MAVKHLIIQYPRGADITVTFVDAGGMKVNTFGMAPPMLLRLGPNLEFESASSGDILELLELDEETETEEEMETDEETETDEGTETDEETEDEDDPDVVFISYATNV